MEIGLRVNCSHRLVWHRLINGKHFSFEIVSIQSGKNTYVTIKVAELSRRGPLIRHNIHYEIKEES